MDRKKLVILTGPTAVGKSSISINLAKKINGEIISADSMQIYKYMDIGSAKVTEQEREEVPHHLIDFLYPDEDYTVANFKEDAEAVILDINKRNKIPIVVGGTGLYINSLVYDLNFTEVEANIKLRKELEEKAKELGNSHVYNILKEIDPKGYKMYEKNDLKRVIRAIEIFEATGKTMTEFNKNFRKERDDYDLTMLCLNMDRLSLYDRINQRVDQMMDLGLLEEVKSLLAMGYDKSLVSMQGIGYKELIMYLDGDLRLEDAVNLIKKKSRNYAKRQLTWFRRDERYVWYNKEDYKTGEELLEKIIKELRVI